MSSSRFPGQGPSYVPAYQVSGVPFVTGSTAAEVPAASSGTPVALEINFPYVTRWVLVQNTGARGLRVGFTKNGVNASGPGAVSNFFTIPSGSHRNNITQRLEVRCKKLFFAGAGGTTGVQVIAGLTGIEEFPILTASNGFEGVG